VSPTCRMLSAAAPCGPQGSSRQGSLQAMRHVGARPVHQPDIGSGPRFQHTQTPSSTTPTVGCTMWDNADAPQDLTPHVVMLETSQGTPVANPHGPRHPLQLHCRRGACSCAHLQRLSWVPLLWRHAERHHGASGTVAP
jgi:hypothetical protein